MKKIAITCGDPAGIGPEIIKKWWLKNPLKRKDVVLIGNRLWLESFYGIQANQMLIVGDPDFLATPGKPNEYGAQIALRALEAAAKGCVEKKYRVVVTGPLSKVWMHKVKFNFPGQTEFFADRWKGIPVMGFVGKKMIVVLATWHIPLKEVPSVLTRNILLKTIQESNILMQKLGISNPRIGVCGLNPHAGEGGLLGNEETDWINPFLNKMNSSFSGLSEAVPGDTIFYRHLKGEFDCVIALYHDQGLGPIKTLEFESAVNITLGLPWLRLGPDHGTAFDIAGKGIASSKSFERAMELAVKLS